MTEERRKRFSFWNWIGTLFSGECQVCKKTTGTHLGTCRRNPKEFIFVCTSCSRNFPEAVKVGERPVIYEEECL